MRMRPMHEVQSLFGMGMYTDGWIDLKRPAHWDSIPKMTVTTKPGDIIFIPAWWWHEVRAGGDDGFTLGISNRGWMHIDNIRSWRHFPIMRFLPGVLSEYSGVGVMPILLDFVHCAPDLFSMLLVKLGLLSSDHLISGKFRSVQKTQHREYKSFNKIFRSTLAKRQNEEKDAKAAETK